MERLVKRLNVLLSDKGLIKRLDPLQGGCEPYEAFKRVNRPPDALLSFETLYQTVGRLVKRLKA